MSRWADLGVDHGWRAANFEEAYGEECVMTFPGRLAEFSGMLPADLERARSEYVTAWELGVERFGEGLWQDGSVRD